MKPVYILENMELESSRVIGNIFVFFSMYSLSELCKVENGDESEAVSRDPRYGIELSFIAKNHSISLFLELSTFSNPYHFNLNLMRINLRHLSIIEHRCLVTDCQQQKNADI